MPTSLTPVLGPDGKPLTGWVENPDGTRTLYISTYTQGQDSMQNAIIPDLNKIKFLSRDESVKKPQTIRKYSNRKKTLYYINANHFDGEEGATRTKVLEAIEILRPQRVIIEAQENTPPPNGEAAFTSTLARQYDIPVIHAEPDDTVVFKEMVKHGYSVKDVMAFYLVRTIPTRRYEGMPMDEEHFGTWAKGYLEHSPYFSTIPAGDRLTYDEFRREYAPRLGYSNFMESTVIDTAPFQDKDARYFQKISVAVTGIREETIDTKIADALNDPEVDSVLVVYGGGHRTMSEPVWEDALGKGVDINPKESLHRLHTTITVACAVLAFGAAAIGAPLIATTGAAIAAWAGVIAVGGFITSRMVLGEIGERAFHLKDHHHHHHHGHSHKACLSKKPVPAASHTPSEEYGCDTTWQDKVGKHAPHEDLLRRIIVEGPQAISSHMHDHVHDRKKDQHSHTLH